MTDTESMTDTELRSHELIREIDRVQREIKTYMQRTDDLLSQLGLTRESLGPMVKKIKENLSPADRQAIAQLEAQWRRELEQQAQVRKQRNAPERSTPAHVRAQLINRI